MNREDIKTVPLEILVNYWEIPPSRIGRHLDGLLHRNVRRIATFVPWQAFESDISHKLHKFLQAATLRNIHVSLILTPEPGIHYPYSALPRDLYSNSEIHAQHFEQGDLQVLLPPRMYSLPSHFSAEFGKRYYNHLVRLNNFLNDLDRSPGQILNHVTAIISGGFWKYYRSPRTSVDRYFAGAAGDFSRNTAHAYRQCVEDFYSQPEFTIPDASASAKWKVRAFDEMNRKWFFQQSEEVYRRRTEQLLSKRALAVNIRHWEIFTPEADPALLYPQLMQGILGNKADLHTFSHLVDAYATRSSSLGADVLPSYVYWTSFGSFRTLSEAEKQFMILKSIIMMGGRGGGIFIDERDWFSLSQAFRTRVEYLSAALADQKLCLEVQAYYLTSHLWSGSGIFAETLHEQLKTKVQTITSVDRLAQDKEATLVVVDPSVVLTEEKLKKLITWTWTGSIVAIPNGKYFSEFAKKELENLFRQKDSIDMNLAIPIQLVQLGDGKLIVYEPPTEDVSSAAILKAVQEFITSLVALANLQEECQLSDPRLTPLVLSQKKMGSRGLGVFVLNSSDESVSADVIFNEEVHVSDLSRALRSHTHADVNEANRSSRFSLEVPPSGILPLSVEGMERRHLGLESHEAALFSNETFQSAMDAAMNELPGFAGFAPDELDHDLFKDGKFERKPSAELPHG